MYQLRANAHERPGIKQHGAHQYDSQVLNISEHKQFPVFLIQTSKMKAYAAYSEMSRDSDFKKQNLQSTVLQNYTFSHTFSNNL